MEKIRNTRILALIGLIALFLGTILPYITFSLLGYSQSITLIGYWEGKVVIALIVANALFIFKDFIEKYIPQMFNSGKGRAIQNANPKLSIIPTILAAGVAIYLSTTLDLDSSYLKYSIGFWILWVGVLCLVAHTLLYKKKNDDSFEQPVQQSYVQQPVQSQPIQNNNQNQQTGVNQTINAKFCPSCGNKVDNNTDTCFMCGHKF